jgi:hypothetical protein
MDSVSISLSLQLQETVAASQSWPKRLPLRQERSPLGLTHPPGGLTDDHETDL